MFGTSSDNNVIFVVFDKKKGDCSGNIFSEKISYEIILQCVNDALEKK